MTHRIEVGKKQLDSSVGRSVSGQGVLSVELGQLYQIKEGNPGTIDPKPFGVILQFWLYQHLLVIFIDFNSTNFN